VRSPINIVPRKFLGIPISYMAVGLSYLPPPLVRRIRALLGLRWRGRLHALGLKAGAPDSFPVIGMEILDLIRAGRVRVAPGVERFTAEAVRFADGSERRFDAVLLATGFRPALGYLADYLPVPDEKQAHIGVLAAPNIPNLYVVGLYYDGLRGTLYLINRQAREVARRVRRSGATDVSDSWVQAANRAKGRGVSAYQSSNNGSG
jgi:hypothetical protein